MHVNLIRLDARTNLIFLLLDVSWSEDVLIDWDNFVRILDEEDDVKNEFCNMDELTWCLRKCPDSARKNFFLTWLDDIDPENQALKILELEFFFENTISNFFLGLKVFLKDFSKSSLKWDKNKKCLFL